MSLVPLGAATPTTDAATILAAVGIGLLIGVERERRKQRLSAPGTAGLRTFTLVSVLGAVLAQLAEPGAIAVGLAFVGGAALLSVVQADRSGLTTPVALVVTYALGALTAHDVELAAALAVGLTLLLAERPRLHRLVRDTLTERELLDGLLLAACALIVLPVLPDRGLGPGSAINPLTIWRLVVAIMLINALGYVALRMLGAKRGLPLAGFIAGFISSTATIAAMGARGHRDPALARMAVAAALASSVSTMLFTAIVLGITSPEVLGRSAGALVGGGIAAILVAAAATRHGHRELGGRESGAGPGRAFDLKTPLLVALTITAVLTLANALQSAMGDSGALVAVAVGGFADAQSAAISAASLAVAGRVSVDTATLGVLLGLTTNTGTKAIAALAFRDRRRVVQTWAGLMTILAAAWAGYLVHTAVR